MEEVGLRLAMDDHHHVQLPCLVYSKEEGDGQVFYDVVHERWGEKNIPWFDHNLCMDANSGWLLLHSMDTHQLSMFHHCTGQQFSLPTFPESSEIDPEDQFICRFSSSPPDCHVIAISRMEKFFYHCRRGQTEWTKHEFYLPESPDPNTYSVLSDATVYDGKIYALVARYLLAIDFPWNNDTPNVSCIKTWGPWEFDLTTPCPGGHFSLYLLESEGELYKVYLFYNYHNAGTRTRTVSVSRMNFSRLMWEVVTSIGDKVFLLGSHYSISLPSAPTKRGMIYFTREDCIQSFNLRFQSLTTYFHCQDEIDDAATPSLLLLEEHQYEEVGSGDCEETSRQRRTTQSMIKQLIHPIYISACPARDVHARKGGVVTWSPRTPWLVLRHGYGSTLKFFDPSSIASYALDIPELSDKQLHHSRDGWLLASGPSSWFFFNPFTKDKIDLPVTISSIVQRVAISSSPASPDCLLFAIYPYSETEGKIDLFRFTDNAFVSLEYTSDLPLELSHSCPAYHNGLFYCLGENGNLGVYDPIANSWKVKDRTWVPFDASTVSHSFLIESDSELFSVFMDEYDDPIGVYCMDSRNERWTEVKHLKGKTIFVGKEASFIVPAAKKRMDNKIYLPVFDAEYCHKLRAHEIGANYSSHIDPFTTIEYMSIWIEPKGVTFELDQATGRCGITTHPIIRLHT